MNGISGDGKRGSAFPAAVLASHQAEMARYGIWYARNEVVKGGYQAEVLKTWVT
jgi:hypothetical protein